MEHGGAAPAGRCLTRRAFFLRCGLGGLGTALAGGSYARYVEPFWPRVERLRMDFPGLHTDLCGLRVLQLSDLHVSRLISDDYLRQQLDRCSGMKPDVIVITGDFITGGEPPRLDAVIALLSRLRAAHGVYAVLGNHDYNVYERRKAGRFAGDAAVANRVAATLARCGVSVLRNQVATVRVGAGRLQLVGLEDLWGGAFDPLHAFAHVAPDVPCLALVHNPDAIDFLDDRPCRWVLCGHTHGGQVRLPLVGALVLPVKHREYDEGLFDVHGRRLYVNRGLGFMGMQLRFLCRPEITEFTLCRSA